MPVFVWLATALAALAERVATWFINKSVKTGTFFLTYATFIVGLYAALLGTTYLAITALRPAIPPGVSFALAFLPPSTALYSSAYFTALIGKRVYDWQKQITRDFTNTTLV